MKKIITVFLILTLIFGIFALTASAEEPVTDEPVIEAPTDTAETPADSPEITVEGEEKAFYEEVVDALTNGANWAKFGGILAAILAALGVLYKYTSGIKTIISGVKSLVEGKASKEDTEAIVKTECERIRSAALTAIEETNKKQAELTEKYNEQTAILTLITLQLVKSPYARTEIMNILATAKTKGKDALEIVEAVEAEIKAAEEAEEKPSTPALDAVVASVSGSEDNGESGVALG